MPHCCMLLVLCKLPTCLRRSSPARAPSHQGLLQPCCRLALRWPMLPTCPYAAPVRRKLVLLLRLPPLDTLMWGEGCIISFRSSDRPVDQYTRVLHRVQAPGGSVRTSRDYTICVRDGILTSTAEDKNKVSQCC
jgi:hypothetical protein